jgi:hypothetical protein
MYQRTIVPTLNGSITRMPSFLVTAQDLGVYARHPSGSGTPCYERWRVCAADTYFRRLEPVLLRAIAMTPSGPKERCSKCSAK